MRTELQKAIALRPNYWRNHSELGFAYYRAGRLDEAADAYRRVTELQPDSALGFHMLGTVQQAAGDTAAALLSYTRANEIRPAYGTWSNMGTILFWQGDYAKAADAYAHAIALAPHEPELYANLARVVRDRLKQRKLARRCFQQAFTLDPRDRHTLDSLLRLLEVEGDLDAIVRALGIAADVTRGCNPPVNDQFCPDRDITRGEMAAFLFRALSDVLDDSDG